MTLSETTDTFINWVQSCKTQEQLDLLREIMDEFVTQRFKDGDYTDLLQATTYIVMAISNQSKLVTLIPKESLIY